MNQIGDFKKGFWAEGPHKIIAKACLFCYYMVTFGALFRRNCPGPNFGASPSLVMDSTNSKLVGGLVGGLVGRQYEMECTFCTRKWRWYKIE